MSGYTRKRVPFVRTHVIPPTGTGGVTSARIDNPYGTSRVAPANSSSVMFCDKYRQNSGIPTMPDDIVRERSGVSFSIPDLSVHTAILDVVFEVYCYGATDTLETANVVLYGSNTDDSSYSGTWYNNFNNYCGIIPVPFPLPGPPFPPYGALLRLPISIPIVTARNNAVLSMILGQEFELAGTGVNPTGTLQYDVRFLARSTVFSGYGTFPGPQLKIRYIP